MLNKAFTDSLFYFIDETSLMGTLFQNVFFYWNFCGCLFMFTENGNKTGKITAKMCFFIIVTVCILSVSFNFFPLSRLKNKKNDNTAISNRTTCRI